MMELKFRSWNTESNKMIEWVDIKRFKNLTKLISLKHVCVMQYVGSKDKNDKDVYEGDIHMEEHVIDGKLTKCYLPIVFDNGAFWIDESYSKDGSFLTLLCEYEIPINIVGNIHENADLIKND